MERIKMCILKMGIEMIIKHGKLLKKGWKACPYCSEELR